MTTTTSNKNRIFLGTYKADKIYTDFNQNANQHMLVTGATGTGKTNFIKVLVDQNSDRQTTILDYSGSFPNLRNANTIHILQTAEIREFFSDLCQKNIPIFADAIQAAWRFGLAQQSVVAKALHIMNDSSSKELNSIVSNAGEDIFSPYLEYEKDSVKKDWALLALILNTKCGSKGEQVATRMLNIVSAVSLNNVCVKHTETAPVTVIHFSVKYYGLNAQLVELYLWKFWLNHLDSKKPSTLILDECQDLQWKKGTIADRLLSEGRKFGIGIILSTQFLAANFPKRTINDFLQSGLRVIFAPSQGEVKEIAQTLNATNYKAWMQNLKRLRVGECVVAGVLCRKNYFSKQTLIINTPKYENLTSILAHEN